MPKYGKLYRIKKHGKLYRFKRKFLSFLKIYKKKKSNIYNEGFFNITKI